jgi:hypothetical protein
VSWNRDPTKPTIPVAFPRRGDGRPEQTSYSGGTAMPASRRGEGGNVLGTGEVKSWLVSKLGFVPPH